VTALSLGKGSHAGPAWYRDDQAKSARGDPMRPHNHISFAVLSTNKHEGGMKTTSPPVTRGGCATCCSRCTWRGRATSTSGRASSLSTVRARPGRLSGRSLSHSRLVLYGAFVWARRALNGQKRWFLARAVIALYGFVTLRGARDGGLRGFTRTPCAPSHAPPYILCGALWRSPAVFPWVLTPPPGLTEISGSFRHQVTFAMDPIALGDRVGVLSGLFLTTVRASPGRVCH
jgi:hypothetical protein